MPRPASARRYHHGTLPCKRSRDERRSRAHVPAPAPHRDTERGKGATTPAASRGSLYATGSAGEAGDESAARQSGKGDGENAERLPQNTNEPHPVNTLNQRKP